MGLLKDKDAHTSPGSVGERSRFVNHNESSPEPQGERDDFRGLSVTSVLRNRLSRIRSIERRHKARTESALSMEKLAVYVTYMNTDSLEILDTWFGPLDAEGHAHPDKVKTWFQKSDAFDAFLREQFLPLVESAIAGGLKDWEVEPGSAVAKILLLDQFTRNIFRNTARMFASDPEALRIAAALLEDERLSDVPLTHQTFVCMPLMHAEDLDTQDRCIREFERLQASAPASFTKGFANNVEYGRRHRAIIERFGRFPHRNAILGRESTAEELEFLKQPGSSF